MAQTAGFKGPGLSKAHRLALQFIELMETSQHVEHDMLHDPKRKPFVIGTLLEFTAGRAANEFGYFDETGEAITYVQRLSTNWDLGHFTTEAKDWYQADQLLRENVPIYNGLSLTLQLNGIDLHKSINSFLHSKKATLGEQLKSLMDKAPEKVKTKPSLGYQQGQQFLKQ